MKPAVTATEGACLCGAVRVALLHPAVDVGVCHCETCRRWGGGPWFALQVPGSNISGPVATFRASRFAERGFCATCGSHIFHRPVDGPELAVAAGLFDDRQFVIAREICVDRQPPNYDIGGTTDRRTTSSLMREWGPKLLWRRLRRALGRD